MCTDSGEWQPTDEPRDQNTGTTIIVMGIVFAIVRGVLKNTMKTWVMSMKESNFNEKNGSKFSHLLTVRADGADPPTPYGQADHKISVFYDFP